MNTHDDMSVPQLAGRILTTMAVLALAGSVSLATGCEEEGPAERAGENLDRAVEDTGDAIEDATDPD